MPPACRLRDKRLRALALNADSRPLGRASHGACLDMGAAMAHTFVHFRPLGRRLFEVPPGFSFLVKIRISEKVMQGEQWLLEGYVACWS